MLRNIGRLRGGGSGIPMPSGAIGLWYSDQYDGATKAIPNAVLGNSLKTNLVRGSRRLFSNGQFFRKQNVTATDDAATAWDGTSEASTLVCTGAWIIGQATSATMPAGTYTVGCNVKSHSGSNEVFGFSGDNTGTRSPVKTATTSWQRFSYTFTRATSFTSDTVLLCSSDGVTGASLEAIDFEIYPGSSDLGPAGPDGNLYLGFNFYSAAPAVSGNVISSTAAGTGVILLPSSTTSANWTVVAVISKTSAGSSYNGIISKIQNYQHLSLMIDQSTNIPYGFVDNSAQQFDDTNGLWNLNGQGYHMLVLRYDGTYVTQSLDDMQMFRVATTLSSQSVRDLYVCMLNGISPMGGTVDSIGLYPSALSNAQLLTAYQSLSARATRDGLTMGVARVLIPEGDSITAFSSPRSYAYLYGDAASPVVIGNNVAVSGSAITDLNTRAAMVDAILPQSQNGRKFILSVLIGRNDLASYGTVQLWCQALATYLDARRSAGWIVVLCTVLPATVGGFNALRNTANTELRLWTSNGSLVPGKHADYIVDFAADPTMGIDGNGTTTGPWNTTYYSDGTHPTAAGHALLQPIYKAVVDAI